jgi:uncharacterized protein affecting Mg2+/Co2+ transport
MMRLDTCSKRYVDAPYSTLENAGIPTDVQRVGDGFALDPVTPVSASCMRAQCSTGSPPSSSSPAASEHAHRGKVLCTPSMRALSLLPQVLRRKVTAMDGLQIHSSNTAVIGSQPPSDPTRSPRFVLWLVVDCACCAMRGRWACGERCDGLFHATPIRRAVLRYALTILRTHGSHHYSAIVE